MEKSAVQNLSKVHVEFGSRSEMTKNSYYQKELLLQPTGKHNITSIKEKHIDS